MQLSAKVRKDLQQQVAVDVGQRTADDVIDFEDVSGVGARLDDDVLRLSDDEQGAVRLNRSSEMNLFTLAVGKRSLPESGRCKRDRGQLTPLMFPRHPVLCCQVYTGRVWRKGFAD